MSKLIIGSKTIANWIDDENPEDWEITSLINSLRQSLIENDLMQSEMCQGKHMETLRKINAATVWALREFSRLKNEMMELMQDGKESKKGGTQ